MWVYLIKVSTQTCCIWSVFFVNSLLNGYVVFKGLERIVKYLEKLEFFWEDIAYLESLGYIAFWNIFVDLDVGIDLVRSAR